MSKYWNERIKNITPYVPGEQPKDKKFIKLNTNENPHPPSPKALEAVRNAANSDLRLYPDPECAAFREAAAKRYGVKKEQVFAGNGSDEILAFAFAAFFEQNSKTSRGGADAQRTLSEDNDSFLPKPVLLPDITYSFYPVYADLWDVPYKTIPLREDFSINCEDYKIPSGGVIFPNPNAPTGVPVPLAEITSLAEYLMEREKVLIVDEAYVAFGAVTAYSCIGKYPNLLTVHTMSKSASFAGLRFGFAIGSEELIEGLCRIRDSFNSYTVDRLAMAGAIAAIEDSAYYAEITAKVIATREKTAKELRGLGFTVLPSAANFLFIKHPAMPGAELFALLREQGILARHFNRERISDFLRVSIGTDEEMDALVKALSADI